MFLARVCLGTYFHTTNTLNNMRRPPQRNKGDYMLYDSVTGTSNVYNEFVVYDRKQCYPEYLIEFKRE